MNAIDWKKLLLPNIPYLLFVYLFDKVGLLVKSMRMVLKN